MTTEPKYTEAKIDLVAKLIADKCGNGMREKYEDVSRQIVELLSERQAAAGLGDAGRVSAPTDTLCEKISLLLAQIKSVSPPDVLLKQLEQLARARDVLMESLVALQSAQPSTNAIVQPVSEPSSETMMLNDRAYEIPVDGIQARYRLPGGEWSTWAHVICGVKTHEMQLRAVGFYPDRHACLHPSWENAGNGKWRCACCNVIGDERRYLQPDGELDRVYDRAERQAMLSAAPKREGK